MDKALAFAYQREGRVFYFETLENILRFDRDPKAHLRIPLPQAIPMNMQGGMP